MYSKTLMDLFLYLLFFSIINSYVIKLSLNKRFDIGTLICPRDSRINPLPSASGQYDCPQTHNSANVKSLI